MRKGRGGIREEWTCPLIAGVFKKTPGEFFWIRIYTLVIENVQIINKIDILVTS